jgi:hypothetical protein
MLKSWKQKIVSVILVLFSSLNYAQQQTNNIIYSTVNPAPQGTSYNWTGFTNTTSNGQGYSGGNVPGYNVNTGTFMFGYNQSTIAYSIAVSAALSGTGVQVNGIDYGFQYYNQDFSRGTLSTNVRLLSPTGTVLQAYAHTLSQTTSGWTNFDQSQTFANPYALSNIGNVTMSWTGKDDRWWAGYYGPQFKNQYIRLNYSSDPCAADPLSSPTCAGYQQAYFTQQCSINPLYDSSCSGYQQAYFTQQCNINPLYNSGCPGYQQAYHDQQCSLNPLYATDCPGYQQAYFTQQCSINPLYNQSCSGYQVAYHDQQCKINPLFATDCPGYQQAYFTQQCNANSLYNSGCPGYQQAYYNQQCNLNGLYDRNCPNYSTAYAKQQVLTPPTTITVTTTTTVSDPVTVSTNPVSVATTQPATTSTTSPTSVTSVTSVIAPAPAPASSTTTTSTPVTTSSLAEQKQETKKAETTVASIEKKAESKSDAKKEATERAKQIAKQAGSATSMESQMDTQNMLLVFMGYVPGFSSYENSMIRDKNMLEMIKKYGKDPIDNRSLLRRLSGSSESRWNEMVDSQYNIEK